MRSAVKTGCSPDRRLAASALPGIYTIIEICKLNGVEPPAAIAEVIAKIAGNSPAARWDEVMP